ncbi:MAG: hypothetical protein ABF283_13935 [Planktotalea arctica]
MTNKSQQLKALKDITELKSELSRAKLSVHRAEIGEIEAVINEVAAARATTAPETPVEAAAAARYAMWAAKRSDTLRAELAMAMARAQPVKEMATKDEARAQVIMRLLKDRVKQSKA